MHSERSSSAFAHFIKRNFPSIDYGFAYGSGVFSQPDLYDKHAKGGAPAGPMLDFIFVVKNPEDWHAQNIQQNWSHYSLLKYFGPGVVCRVADYVGAGVYFNTMVPVEGQMIKYGVIGQQALEQDLHHWSQLYVSGRLHKPVAALLANAAAEAAVSHNLHSALVTALLLSPSTISLKDFFKRITSISYMGDVRMGLAEDSKKVERIVSGSYSGFQQLYLPLLQEPRYKQFEVSASPDGLQQSDSQDSKLHLFSRLPAVLLARVAHKLGPAVSPTAATAAASVLSAASASVSAPLPPLAENTRLDIAAAAFKSPKWKKLVKGGLRAIVANSSRRQAVAGLLYAGPVRSLRYVGRKLAKAWK